MVRKIFFIVLSMFLFQLQSQAVENGDVLNLKTGNSYIIPTANRPMNIKITNKDIVKASAVTSFDEEDSSILVTTKKEGISYISFKLKNKEVRLRLLIDDLGQEDENLIKLDMLEGYKQ